MSQQHCNSIEKLGVVGRDGASNPVSKSALFGVLSAQ
jgi:hypothetical protein